MATAKMRAMASIFSRQTAAINPMIPNDILMVFPKLPCIKGMIYDQMGSKSKARVDVAALAEKTNIRIRIEKKGFFIIDKCPNENSNGHIHIMRFKGLKRYLVQAVSNLSHYRQNFFSSFQGRTHYCFDNFW